MSKIKLSYISAVFFMLFVSCNDKIEKKLIGDWLIQKLMVNNKEEPLPKFFSFNTIEFKEGNECVLPLVIGGIENENANWKISKSEDSYFIEFDSNDPIFKGKFSIEFDKSNSRKQFILKKNEYSIFLKKLFDY